MSKLIPKEDKQALVDLVIEEIEKHKKGEIEYECRAGFSSWCL